jgi:hypothetical protein
MEGHVFFPPSRFNGLNLKEKSTKLVKEGKIYIYIHTHTQRGPKNVLTL